MNTSPSKRELQHFLKRFVPDTSPSMPRVKPELNQQSAPGVQSPKDFVNELLSPSSNQIALTKVEGPFDRTGWQSVGSTLLKLQKLGMTSIVVADSISWRSEEPSVELTKRMTRESMALVEAIESAGGRARPIYGGLLEQGVSDIQVNFEFIQSALDNNQIPVVFPILSNGGMQQPIRANEAMVALTRSLAGPLKHKGITPARIVVINSEGGIPNHERPGTAHSLVNVQEEYDDIVKAYEDNVSWQKTHPGAIENLDMVKDCLSCLPTTSSAIIVPTSSLPKALIANLVTDKPLYSSSLPISNLRVGSPDLQQVNRTRSTVLRHGIKINNYTNLSDLDLPRLTKLLEASFQKKVDQSSFYARLERDLAGAIIAGDYEGAVLMTQERSTPEAPGHYYLDKFAIAPTSQGIGLTDILWKRMCDAYPELLWRSRQDNGVNKWYFERSNGYLRLKGTQWVLFWHGSKGFQFVEEYATIAKAIPASFSGLLTNK
ncbi:hypothetical protein CLU79DRAFT_733701 [Phycomyces nitens]|nr:hypothetical protein CLU79DRAFT_733701 [Phycomyces nitens]